jgi:high-affinity Fe2+/Pb2+ permease
MRLPRTVVWAGLIVACVIGQLMIWKEAAEGLLQNNRKSSAVADDLDVVAGKGSY